MIPICNQYKVVQSNNYDIWLKCCVFLSISLSISLTLSRSLSVYLSLNIPATPFPSQFNPFYQVYGVGEAMALIEKAVDRAVNNVPQKIFKWDITYNNYIIFFWPSTPLSPLLSPTVAHCFLLFLYRFPLSLFSVSIRWYFWLPKLHFF